MRSTVTRVFSGYETDIIPEEGRITISMKSIDSDLILETVFTENTMPAGLHNLINTPHELFIALQSISKDHVRVVNQDILVMKTEVFSLFREYSLPLDRKDAPTQVLKTQLFPKQQQQTSHNTFSTMKKQFSFQNNQTESQGASQSRKEKLLSELNYSLSKENYDLQQENLFNAKIIEQIQSKNNYLSHSNIKLAEERDQLQQENRFLNKEKNRLSQLLVEGDEKEKAKREIGTSCGKIENIKVEPKEEKGAKGLQLQVEQLQTEEVNLMEKIANKQRQIAYLTQERAKLAYEKLDLMKAINELKKEISEMTDQVSKFSTRSESERQKSLFLSNLMPKSTQNYTYPHIKQK